MKLAERIVQVLENHEIREQMGVKSQERAFSHFDIQTLADQLAHWLLHEI
jgi:glycosyltransferase involved in cell wall biosynthesis